MKSGSICIEVEDGDGDIVFKQDAMETSAFTIDVSGRVLISVKAVKHKGSFSIAATGGKMPGNA